MTDNVINLADHVEKNFWDLVRKGHLKDVEQELIAATEEAAEPFFDLPIPANDEGQNPNEIAISLEDLVLDDDTTLSKNYAWEDNEFDPNLYE